MFIFSAKDVTNFPHATSETKLIDFAVFPYSGSLKVILVCGSDLLESFSIPDVWIPEQVFSYARYESEKGYNDGLKFHQSLFPCFEQVVMYI